ncbi:GNAT family N-acetyltransferase [Arthrobacter roseus]|uniref:GNAT family N-acetyltransferase n=1 Tax=Arthrobacter roseus TaxID=136274 RepID=UPI001962F761|nr:GNAT family N-acetyltransferase [Arthrobacter roseus]MBM7847319.1 putative GNAT family acetyltransferase [Arthrobacter roseus]
MNEDNTVIRNEERNRYEITVDGDVAGFIDFREGEGYMDFVHTEVKENFSGQGLAGQLTKGAVSDAVSTGAMVKPTCTYVAKWFQKHPEFREYVAD